MLNVNIEGTNVSNLPEKTRCKFFKGFRENKRRIMLTTTTEWKINLETLCNFTDLSITSIRTFRPNIMIIGKGLGMEKCIYTHNGTFLTTRG